MGYMIRVAAVDDHPLFLVGIAHVLENADDIEVVGLRTEPTDVASLVKDAALDVLLLDMSSADATGLDIVRSIADRRDDLNIVILSASADAVDIAAAFDAGANGYVLKEASGDELIEAIRTVYVDRQYISNSLVSQVFRSVWLGRAAPPASLPCTKVLDAIEIKILESAARGLTNKEIAREISRDPQNIRYKMGTIMRKLRVKNRVQAILQFKEQARH